MVPVSGKPSQLRTVGPTGAKVQKTDLPSASVIFRAYYQRMEAEFHTASDEDELDLLKAEVQALRQKNEELMRSRGEAVGIPAGRPTPPSAQPRPSSQKTEKKVTVLTPEEQEDPLLVMMAEMQEELGDFFDEPLDGFLDDDDGFFFELEAIRNPRLRVFSPNVTHSSSHDDSSSEDG